MTVRRRWLAGWLGREAMGSVVANRLAAAVSSVEVAGTVQHKQGASA